jgi:hypothetical protein
MVFLWFSSYKPPFSYGLNNQMVMGFASFTPNYGFSTDLNPDGTVGKSSWIVAQGSSREDEDEWNDVDG